MSKIGTAIAAIFGLLFMSFAITLLSVSLFLNIVAVILLVVGIGFFNKRKRIPKIYLDKD